MNCACGTQAREVFVGIASTGKNYWYCPNCKEDVEVAKVEIGLLAAYQAASQETLPRRGCLNWRVASDMYGMSTGIVINNCWRGRAGTSILLESVLDSLGGIVPTIDELETKDGILLADGRSFDPIRYPALFIAMGLCDRVPDLRTVLQASRPPRTQSACHVPPTATNAAPSGVGLKDSGKARWP